MPQIQKGDTFADGQQVTGARLNQLVDSATILPAIITDQTNLTANTVATGDSVLLYDASATALREATASDLLNSNIAVTTSSITGGANSDIVITPNDGATVTGATYTSGDGLTVVVTLNSHGLAVNQVVTISGAGSGYNGTFRITAVATNTFTYVMTTAATPATAQSCSYTRQGTVRNPEHAVIGGNVYVNGDSVVTGTSVNTGAVTNVGNVSVGGNLTVTGTTTANLATTSTAVTQTSTDSSTKIATTAFVSATNPFRAWVNFNGVGTAGNNLTINSSFNVTNVVYNATGDYTINFTNNITDANYAVFATGNTGGNPIAATIGIKSDGSNNVTLKTSSQLRMAYHKDSTGAAVNGTNISVLVIR